MTCATLSRRDFNRLLAGGLLAAGLPGSVLASRSRELIVAAVQMEARLADVAHNRAQAERLVHEALRRGATWIVLPEMFTSAAAFHPGMLDAIEPLEGPTLAMLRRLAKSGNAVIGGSFLARRDGGVFNSFVLVFPDGNYVTHDKDLPTYWENCFYQPGHDDGVLETPLGPVGAALCWELIRAQTAKRLAGRVGLLLAASCWWTLPDDADANSPRRAANLKMLRDAPPRMARMLGVPVVHGSHAGRFAGFFSPELPDVPYNSDYLGEAMIVDATGRVLARRTRQQGAGVVTATITLPARPSPSMPIPDSFWIPAEMPRDWQASWRRWLKNGADYFAQVTQVYLDTGERVEYVPIYLR